MSGPRAEEKNKRILSWSKETRPKRMYGNISKLVHPYIRIYYEALDTRRLGMLHRKTPTAAQQQKLSQPKETDATAKQIRKEKTKTL